MKRISTLFLVTVLALVNTVNTALSQGDLIASIYFNPLDTDPTKRVHLYLYFYNNANSNENLVQIRWAFLYNPDVLSLVPNETEVLTYKGIDPSSGLNSSSFLTDRTEVFSDLTPSYSELPSTSITAIPVYNINPDLPASPIDKTFNVMEYQRSAGKCDEVLIIPGKETQMIYHAVFVLKPSIDPSIYKLDTADNGMGTPQFIAEFISQTADNEWPTPSNQFKEIVLVKYHDLSMLRPRKYTGNCPSGGDVNGATTQPMDVNDYFLKPTPAILPTALPLILHAFNAVAKNGEVHTSWNTSKEVNIRSFNIQRTADNQPFKTIGSVASNNNNGVYQFKDLNPIACTAMYRLQILEKNGGSMNSPIVTVKSIVNTQPVVIIPNPANNHILIKFPAAVGAVQVRLLSVSGQPMGKWRLQYSGDVQLTNIPSGIYIVECVLEKNGNKTTSLFMY